MKAIMVMFDSLNRHMLSNYGCTWTKTPNFKRLEERMVTFDQSYVCSMPCMPARREIHTGRSNFLHRSWGPLDPYDDSMPELLKKNGVYTHLVSDHWHYWEAGGANYHTKYNSFEWARGQEGDGWKSYLPPFDIPEYLDGRPGLWGRQDWVNRRYMQKEEELPIAVTFHNGLEFIENNHGEDNWFLQLEAFDPHEPFYSLENYKELYRDGYEGPVFDWPSYHQLKETPEQIQHCIHEYAAVLSMCDHYLGKVLDMMDEYEMWDDTMLIGNTDHGFLRGEHDWWGKVMMPFYNEIAHTPLFIWDPRSGRKNERRQALVQTIDLCPTLLEFFGVDIPEDVLGKSLTDTIDHDAPVREYALFGMHGCHVNITDGHYVYMRASAGGSEHNHENLNNYTLMPAHMKDSFDLDELKEMKLVEGFSFTKGLKVLSVPGTEKIATMGFPPATLFDGGNMLFDVIKDPGQEHPIHDPETEQRMVENMIRLMEENDAPEEQYVRLGLR